MPSRRWVAPAALTPLLLLAVGCGSSSSAHSCRVLKLDKRGVTPVETTFLGGRALRTVNRRDADGTNHLLGGIWTGRDGQIYFGRCRRD